MHSSKSVPFFILISLVSIVTRLAAEEEPERLTLLRESYNREMDRVVKPVNQKYLEALKSLQVVYTKAGDLEAALAVKAEIEKLNTESTPNTSAKEVVTIPEEAIKFGDRHFLVVDAPEINFDDARKEAKKMGGVLASATSDETRDFLLEIAKRRSLWIGLYYDNGRLKWVSEDKYDEDNPMEFRLQGPSSTHPYVRMKQNEFDIAPNDPSSECSGYVVEFRSS